jgi:Predicted exporters of the RND superfamily
MESLTQDGHPVVQQTLSMVTTGSAAYTYYDAASAAALLGREERDVQTIFNLLRIETPIRGDALIEKLSAALQRISFLVPGDALAQLQQAQELLDQADAAFNGPNYSRAMLVLDLTPGTSEAHDALLQIKAVLRDHYADDSALAGVPVALDDIATSFKGDMLRVNLITIGLILLIILISFRSAVIPLLLVCVIQGAIWINMCVSNILDNSVFFMCYLICVALQMGATVDYGILLTNHYRALRSHVDKKESAREAIRLSLPTILTSGAALSVAGFTVGIISSVFYISSIGTMLARGAIISVSLVLFLLPQLLQWLDRWIVPSYYSE